jgi:hypothetical protein
MVASAFVRRISVTCGDVPQRNILYVDFGFPLPVGELHHHEAFDISA